MPSDPNRAKSQAVAVSLGIHIAVFLALMYAPPIGLSVLPERSPSEYQQAFAGKEDKIVWYEFHELPDITPQKSAREHEPLRAAVKAKQAIVSSQKNAPKRAQVVITPVPAVELPPLDLPNLIAVKLPPKQFTTPPDLVRPGPPDIKLPEAAGMPVPELEAEKLPVDRLPAKPYIPPQSSPRPVQIAKIEPPSDLPEHEVRPIPSAKLPAIRLPARAYVPPPPPKPVEARKIGPATEAESVAMNTPAAAALPGVKLPARAFAPPPRPEAQHKASVAVPQIDGPAGDVTIAIAGLNPATTSVKLPAASSPAQFSAGEKVRPDGASSDGTFKGVTVSDLYAHGTSESKPNLLALTTAPPTSKAFIDDSLRRRPLSEGTRVSNAPDSRFNGRDVYMMAIQMSNLTSDSGSWLMWYSARTMEHTAQELMTAPVPFRKVDPRYTPAAREAHIEGRVQLYCVIGREGHVSSIELLRGADDRLNQSAEEALSKWEFYPATRNGQPVDVDAVVEIPFVIGPPPLK